jgi:hypothetical protein
MSSIFEFLPKFSNNFFFNGNFVLYEKHHSHFVVLAYALIFYQYVGWAIIFFRRHGNLLNDIKLAYNLENKHIIIC